MSHRIAMIGTGYMAQKHSAVLQKVGADLYLVVGSGRRSGDTEKFRSQHGFRASTDKFEHALTDPTVDIVYICTPDDTHAPMVEAALSAGKNVFCEKPLARAAEDFEKIGRALRVSGKLLQVGMNCRYREQYALHRNRVKSNSLGALRYIRGTYIYNAVPSMNKREKPWAAVRHPHIMSWLHGGAIHCLDLLRWIGGPVKSVLARARGFELQAEFEADTFSISFEFTAGAIGDLLTTACAFRPNEFVLESWLARGSIVGSNVYQRDSEDGVSQPEALLVQQKEIDLVLQYDDLVRAIAERRLPLNCFVEAYENYRTIQAIEQSARLGRPVYMSS